MVLRLKTVFVLFILSFCSLQCSNSSDELQRGVYFSKKVYIQKPVPTFSEHKDRLPMPILSGNPDWIAMYWKCWEIAFRGFKSPRPGSPLVSNWLDEAFSENIFQWDTIFMMMFARYGHEVFPAIESLDNFYRLQRKSGFIGREFRERDGRLIHFDFNGGLFSAKGWKNMVNPPLFSWAEVESYRVTGDKSRFKLIITALEKYAEWLDREGDPEAENWEAQGRKSLSTKHRLYWNTPLGSGMDNTPRPAGKGAGWVEMSSQMVIMYNNLAIICRELGQVAKADKFSAQAKVISSEINKWCWNESDGFYYDVLADGTQYKKKTIAGFWPLLAEVASPDQAERLVDHLKNKQEFWRRIVFSTLSADEPEFRKDGGYWLGGVWAPTNVMVIKGLERYGYEELAAEATENYLRGMSKVFQDSLTVYENYAPDFYSPGNPSRPDFVGWTGCGPIQLLIENVIGIKADGGSNAITWKIRRADRHGVNRLTVGNNTVSMICEKRKDKASQASINVSCKKSVHLTIIHPRDEKTFSLSAGNHIITIG